MALDFPASPTNGQVYGNYYYNSSVGAWSSFATATDQIPSTLKNLTVSSGSTTGVSLKVTPFTTSSVNLQEWYNTSSTVVASMNVAGEMSLAGLTLATDLTVPNGGTGAASFTSGAYLKGAGTSPITAQAGIPAGDITSGTLGVARGGTGVATLTGYAKGSGTNAFSAVTTIPVADGGTGATTLTSGGYLKGAGTGVITSQVGIPAGDITSGSLAIARGGTGSTTGAGMVSIIPTSTTIFNGAGTATVNANGLVTFTNVNSFAVNGIYSTAYDYVLVKFVQWNGPANYLYARLCQSGSYTTVAAYYGTAFYKQGGGLASWDDYSARAYVSLGYLPTSENSGSEILVYNALNSAGTGNPIIQFDSYYMGGAGTLVKGVAKWNGTPLFDGLNLYSSAGNLFSGTLQVYGFRKS